MDIGTNSIKLIVCELYKNKLNLLAATQTPSIGIKRGLITDVEAAKSSIKKAFDEVESMLGIRINKVIAAVPNYGADYEMVKGKVEIKNEKGIITTKDIKKCLENAIKNKMPSENEIVTDLVVDFKVDDKHGVKEPQGLLANNLEVRSILATVPKKNIYSVATILDSLNIELADISLGNIGDIAVFKNEKISEIVSSIINIGYETTTVSLYNRGILIRNSIIPLGSMQIEKDLAYIYKTTVKTAKTIKEKFALAHKRNASVSDFYEIVNNLDEKVKISRFEASEIVMARIEEILNNAKDDIANLTTSNIDYIIITGGTSNMQDFEYIANDVFGKKVVLGNVKMLGIRSNVYSSALGNVIHFINKLKLVGSEYTMISEEDEEGLDNKGKGLLSNLDSESRLGKVFGYFFNE